MRKYIYALIFIVFSTTCFGAELIQRIEIPSSFNPVGSGARALGMGGAFISVADDATAASWNPGGLIQLEMPEISVVYDMFHRSEDNYFGVHPESSGIERVSEGKLNYFSAAYPFTLKDYNMIVSLNYQKLYDFSRKWGFPMNLSAANLLIHQNTDYRQEGDLSALGLAYCIQITPRFSFGFTLNIWDDNLTPNTWEQKIIQTGEAELGKNKIPLQFQSYDRYSFKGINANFGFLWNITDKMTIGAVLKTPFTADIRHEQTLSGIGMTSGSTVNDEQLTMPMSYGLGISYRFLHNFMVSFDIYRTQWNDFLAKDSYARETSPITGKSADESDIHPTHQLRIGAEYLKITKNYIIPVCFGAFYDPAPATGGTDDIFGFTLGSGIGFGRFNLDLAYQYRFGNNIGSSILKNLDFSQDLREHTLYSSVIVHF
ncbi:MAG TPA: hypothetical protein DCQ37_16170 [Desulfobacteraceae bacterium]|nr:hypothetical protein [Desulfobacteraceae bacterium]